MEAIAAEDHITQVTIPFKRFSRIEYPSHEKGGEHEGALKVKCKGGKFAGYQHFYCSECNEELTLEPICVGNVHQNIRNRKNKYSVLQIGAKCPKCKKIDMIKIPFNAQFIMKLEEATRLDNKHLVP